MSDGLSMQYRRNRTELNTPSEYWLENDTRCLPLSFEGFVQCCARLKSGYDVTDRSPVSGAPSTSRDNKASAVNMNNRVSGAESRRKRFRKTLSRMSVAMTSARSTC